jgi:hypothetical protein
MKLSGGTLVIAVLLSIQLTAQVKPEPVDMKKVKSETTNPDSEFFYKKLHERFKARDTTMTVEHYRMFYYGFAFHENYSAYPGEKTREIRAAMDKKDYLTALRICDSVIDKYPVLLQPNYMKAVCLIKAGNDSLGRLYYKRYSGLAGAILSTGDGLTCKTGFKVLFVSDEYSIMYGELEIEEMSQQALVSPCDAMSVEPSKIFKSKLLYFDAGEVLKKEAELFEK